MSVRRLLVHGLVRLHGAARAAVDRLAPAELLLAERITGISATALTGALVETGLADRLARGRGVPRTAAELATEADLAPDVTERLLRAAAALGLASRTREGYRENRLTRALASEAPRSLAPMAAYFASEANVRAWSRFGAAAAGEVPYHRAHGRSVWEHLADDTGEAGVFARAMEALTRLEADTVVRTPPFAELARLCDVAGGTGTLLRAWLRRAPAGEGVLFDAGPVVELARARFAEERLLGRVELREGNVFEEVPAGVEAYALKDVLHDWDDARASVLLGRVRAAMSPGARLLVVESMLDGPAEALIARVDLQMMTVTDGGRQRSRAELARLLREAGFSAPVVHATELASSVLESRAV